MAEFTWKFSERKMDWPTSNSMVFSRQGQPSISQGEVIQKLLYHHLRNFTRNSDFTWRVSDCEELVVVTHRRWCDWPYV